MLRMVDAYERGMQVRREVLGDEYVDQTLSATTDFDRDFQTWITTTAWGGVWDRPGLDRRTRSLLTVALLAGLGREELAVHLPAAIRNGVTSTEIGEVLMQVAVYAGVPAANQAFKLAKALLEEPGP